MFKKTFLILFLLFHCHFWAQELNCLVTVNADFVNQTNRQIFKTLERSLNDFINKTRWTNKNVLPHERIACSMLLTITAYEGDRFAGTLQLQSNRPVFDAAYETSVFNYQDKQLSFEYLEYQPLFFNPNSFDSNLVAVISYYVYVMLGIDADTFSLKGGDAFFEQAQNIVNLAQGSGHAGWRQTDGNRTRWELIDNLRSNTFGEYRSALYTYHLQGIDQMTANATAGKAAIIRSLKSLEQLASRRPNSLLLQLFFDAKVDELKNIFSGGPKIDLPGLINTLNKVAPFYANSWNEIKQ
jgi:hypothetical protein